MLNELRFAIRQLLKNPGFTSVAVLTLALGIGANTAIFSIVNAILLRPLPVKDAAELLAICYRNQDGSLEFPNVSFPFYRMYRDECRSFSGFIGYAPISVTVREGEKPTNVRGQLVSENYFEALGIRPIRGRAFSPAEDEAPGREAVAVLSFDYWRQRFGGDTNLIGQKLHVKEQALTIVGIAPEGFRGLHSFVPADFWAPSTMEQALGAHTVYRMVGRLARGVTRGQAIAELDSITQRISEAYGRTAPPGYERYGLMSADRRTTLLPAALGSWGPERGGRDKVNRLAAMFMGGNGLDANREIDRRKDGHGDATTWIILCQFTFADRLRPRPVRGHVCLRGLNAGTDCSRPRTVCIHVLFQTESRSWICHVRGHEPLISRGCSAC